MQAIVRPEGLLTFHGLAFRAALGSGGVRTDKQEGDGATPAGHLHVRRVLYRADREPRVECKVPIEPIAPNDGWSDDPDNRDYNRMIRLPHDGHYEELWRQDGLYDLVAVLGWNDAPIRRGLGSAIFLHIARPDFAPTAGCIALALGDLRHVLSAGLTDLLVMPA